MNYKIELSEKEDFSLYNNSSNHFPNKHKIENAKNNMEFLDYGFNTPFLSSSTWLTPEQAAWNLRIPFLKKIRIVKDPCGLFAIFIVHLHWLINVNFLIRYILIPNYTYTVSFAFLILGYIIISSLCLLSLWKASLTNPGYIHINEDTEESWSYCNKCNKKRPPSSHHCRRCGQCVRKMDHHCPWINNCVGEDNQGVFMLLCFYTFLLSVLSFVVLVFIKNDILECITCQDYENFYLFFSLPRYVNIALVLSVLTSLGGASLFFTQHFSVIFEVSSMEMTRRQFIFLTTGNMFPLPKQTKSTCELYKNVCGSRNIFCWFFPRPLNPKRILINKNIDINYV